MWVWERTYPYIISLLVAAVVYYLKWDISDVKNLTNILSASVTISAIIIGFLATMASVLISLVNSKVMSKVRENKAEKVLTRYIKIALIAGLILAVYSLVLNIFDTYQGVGSNWMLIVLISLMIFFILSSFRIFNILLNILTSVLTEGPVITENKDKKEFTPTLGRRTNK